MDSYGMRSFVALNFQNSFGTQLTTSLHWVPFLSENVGLNKPALIDESLRGVFDEGDDFEGPVTVTGDLETNAHPITLGALLSAALGKPTSVTSTGIRTHTFLPRTADFDALAANVPFTYYKYLQDGGSAFLFYDLVGNAIELSVAAGELMKAKLSVVGGRFAQIAAIAEALPTGKPRWPWSVASVQIGGAAIDEIVNATITLTENVEAMHTLNNSIFPNRVKRTGFRTVAFEGTVKFDNQSEYQQFISQSEREAILFFKGPIEVQSGFTEDFTLRLPLMRYREFKPEVGGPGQVEVAFTAAGKYSVSSATALRATLVNTLAGY